jgi:hypothetical protein
MNVLQPSTNATELQRTILPSNRRIGIWRGRHTLATGKNLTLPGKTNKTSHASSGILLSNIHPHRTKLRHIRKRITGNNEITSTLATIPGMDQRTIYHPNGPRQPAILEVAKEPQPKDRKMARRSTRIRLRNPTHTRKNECDCGRSVSTTKGRPRRGR